MYTRRWKNNCCYLINNDYNHNSDEYETICDDIIDNCGCDNYNNCCDCGYEDSNSYGDIFPVNPMFGQSYVPTQTMNMTYKPCVGLQKGTIFHELVSSYSPCQSIDFINYIKENNSIGKGCNG